MMKKNKGITLIALVVTIIVLLILAGISIATLTGQNGILTRGNEAKDENVKARERDEIGLAYNAAKITNEENNKSVVEAEDLQNALISDGVQNTNTSQENERIKIVYTDSSNIYYINGNGEIVDGGKLIPASREGLKVGDYIDYTPDSSEVYSGTKLASNISGTNSNTSDVTQDTLNWQILRIYDNGKVDLIGSSTNHTIGIQGALGYNNGVYLMNDICEHLYSKPSKGIIARSVNHEDFELWLTEDGKRIRDSFNNGVTPYGQVKTYTSEKYRYYPNLYAHEKGSGVNTTTVRKDGINSSKKNAPEFATPTTETYTQANSTGLTITEMLWSAPLYEGTFGDGYVPLKSPNYYWVASRFSNSSNLGAYFGIRIAWSNSNGGRKLFHSENIEEEASYSLRPVITLRSDIKITKNEGENSSSNPHTINW